MLVTINYKPAYQITSDFGVIDSIHKIPHTGIDLAVPIGTDIISPVEGYVSRIIDMGNENIGKAVVVKLQNGNELIFGHLSKFNVKVNQVVHEGQKIAESGNSGFSTGAHLHIGLKTPEGFVDPSKYEHLFQNVSSSNMLASATDGSIFKFFKSGSDQGSVTSEFVDSVKYLKSFVEEAKAYGLFYTITGETFGQWVVELLKDIGMGFLKHNDIFLMAPAILFMFATFIIGKNKYTRYIIPLWFIYFITEILFHKFNIDNCIRPQDLGGGM